MARNRRKRGRIRREDLTQEEIRRLKIKRKRKLMLKRKRRFYALLFVVLALFIVMFIVRFKGEKNNSSSISSNTAGLPSAGASEVSGAYENNESDDASVLDTEEYYDEYAYTVSSDSAMRPNARLDVTKGQAAVNLETISGNSIEKVKAAKYAMSTVAYFPGTTRTVNDYFEAYGEGKWHGIQDAQDNILVFYEGKRSEIRYETDVSQNVIAVHGPEKPFKISMIMYDDGSFVVQNVIESGNNIDDYESFLMDIISGSGSN